MDTCVVVLTIVLAIGCCVQASAVECVIAPDGMAVVDGTRTFILGLYENPKEDAVLKRVAEAGFNLVRASADRASLDRLDARGLWAWINTGMAIDFSEDSSARTARLKEMAQQFGPHPALLVWEVPDEALWNCWYIPQGWRWDREPAMLTEKIKALGDAARQARLRKMLGRSNALRLAGDYGASEDLADRIWKELGETSPRPEVRVSTAPERSRKMAFGMRVGYELLRSTDPGHPVWMNHAPRNQIAQLARFNQAADIVGCDIYPVPDTGTVRHSDLGDRRLSAVGAFTDRMQAAAPGKPVWMVLQGFGWGEILPERPEEVRKELRQPTARESRFMAYDAIVHGARGILYWGTAYLDRTTPFWDDLLALIHELHGLRPVLSAPDAQVNITCAMEETFGSVDVGIRMLAKDVDGKLWIIVVNEWTSPLKGSLSGLDGMEGKTFIEITRGTPQTVQDGKLQVSLADYEVQVLAEQ